MLYEIKDILKQDDIVDNNKCISAYTLYKYLSDMFNPLCESLNDPNNVSKVWDAWNRYIRDLDPDFKNLPFNYKEANFRIIPFLEEDYNRIAFRINNESTNYQFFTRWVGSNAFYYTPDYFREEGPMMIDSFFQEEKDNFNRLFDLLDLYQGYYTYFIKVHGDSLALRTDAFGISPIKVRFSFVDLKKVEVDYGSSSYTTMYSHWSDGRLPIYKYLDILYK